MSLSQLKSSAAVLLVKDIFAAADHYRDKLGFAYDQFHGEPPGFCIVYRDDCYLMLKQVEPEHVIPHWTVSRGLCDAYFWVADVDELHRELVGRGATIDFGLCEQPYGCREFGIQDVDGHDIVFGQVIRREPAA